MDVKTIDSALLVEMITNGSNKLYNNYKIIDDLNVFPVPDGDTGTNMSMTMRSGVEAISNLKKNEINNVFKHLSRGLLMGARGNSGVILSQIFRGMHLYIKDLDLESIDATHLSKLFESGVTASYKAVNVPVEGTILTVSREASEELANVVTEKTTINDALKIYLKAGKKSLDNTPNLLPVLKEAGVVDSGGAGFLEVVEGMLLALEGTIIETDEIEVETHSHDMQIDVDSIEFAYCTEFIVNLNEEVKKETVLKAISDYGDSVVVVVDEDILKIHIHTNQPGEILTIAQGYGEFVTIKIENMKVQATASPSPKKAKKTKPQNAERVPYAIITVADGQGLVNTFEECGADYVINGGQSMNPSTEDFVSAIKEVHAENVIIIPNNSNVILSAKQAKKMVRGTKVEVLNSKTIAQGYSAILQFDPELDIKKNSKNMGNAISHVKTGEITYAVRNTEINNIKIEENDFMGIIDGNIEICEKERKECLKRMFTNLLDEDSEIVTLFYGKTVEQSELDDIENILSEINDEVELELISGQQEIYSYIIAVE